MPNKQIALIFVSLFFLQAGCSGGWESESTKLESVSISPADASLEMGKVQVFTALRDFSNGTTKEIPNGVTWEVDNTNVATIDQTGQVTAIAGGPVTIIATDTEKQLTGTTILTVTPPVGLTFWDTKEVAVPAKTTDYYPLEVAIPEPSAGIGLAVQGNNGDTAKLIESGLAWSIGGSLLRIRDPGNVPIDILITPMDSNENGVIDTIETLGAGVAKLSDRQTTSLFFPSDGSVGNFAAGTYFFPILTFDGLNALSGTLQADVLQPYLYYKTEVAAQTTLTLNVFVVSGVGGITSVSAALADPEILGSVQKLRKVYERDHDVAIRLDINIDLIPDASYAVLDTEAEAFELYRTYPQNPTHDAMNIFIIDALDYLDAGVLGVAARIPGPFNRQGTIKSGTVAEYQGDGDGDYLGSILAHEFGHFLGLYHTSQTNSTQDGIIGLDPISDTQACTTADIINAGVGPKACPDVTNLMFPLLADPTADISAKQGIVIRLNPGVLVK